MNARSQPRLPTCRAGFELSRCVSIAVAPALGRSRCGRGPRRWMRYPSGVELAVLLGLHVARRGFWDALSQNSPRRENAWLLVVGCRSSCRERRSNSSGKGRPRESRRRVGTREGLIPYSCLVPPRYFPLVEKVPKSGHRCLNHPGAEVRKQPAVRNKIGCSDYDVQKDMQRSN